MNVKPNRRNENFTTQHPYYFHKPNYNNAPYTLNTSFTYNITQPVVMTNLTNYTVRQPIQQFGYNYTIHAAKEAGFIDKLKENYTKCRLITMFQSKSNYLRLREVVTIYFSVYYRALVYEGSLREAINLEMNDILSLIEIDDREIIIRLCEPYQLVRNDILSLGIINSECEVDPYDINPDKKTIKESISKVTKWLRKQSDIY